MNYGMPMVEIGQCYDIECSLQGSQKLFGFGQADICGNEDDPTLVCKAHSACVACSY